ncbi:hypothetical protein D3841_05500 [Streptococcus mutans]|nr:hypothetical protein [Streptococcus mutans]NLQ46048.1 hypothetical protein [Streptococcus mutans]NLQ61641.1 hypothetical protein [Streptococcus mutans]NLQ73418.1 hypothetical protein [Streptococcus mutans]NLQ78362.1 hypothetical protein [Streptococcus mutans]
MGAGFFKSLLENKNAMKRWSRLLVCQSPKTGWQKTSLITNKAKRRHSYEYYQNTSSSCLGTQ